MKILFTLLFAAVLSFAAASHAQNYPSKPVRILVGFAPGGSTDLTARIFAQELNKLWGSQVVVDNRPGASGMIGAELASKAPPDGHTWLVSPQTSIVRQSGICTVGQGDPRSRRAHRVDAAGIRVNQVTLRTPTQAQATV